MATVTNVRFEIETELEFKIESFESVKTTFFLGVLRKPEACVTMAC
jgi:hypothetical protein